MFFSAILRYTKNKITSYLDHARIAYFLLQRFLTLWVFFQRDKHNFFNHGVNSSQKYKLTDRPL